MITRMSDVLGLFINKIHMKIKFMPDCHLLIDVRVRYKKWSGLLFSRSAPNMQTKRVHARETRENSH